MAVRKVSINKSDLQCHSRALAIMPFDRSHDFLLVLHCSYVSITVFPKFKEVAWFWTHLFWGSIYYAYTSRPTPVHQSAHKIWSA